jgi:glycine cleavage system H protein
VYQGREGEKEMPPEELKYSPEHFWLKSEKNGTVRVGITDYYQAQLQKIVFIELPEVGTSLEKRSVLVPLRQLRQSRIW